MPFPFLASFARLSNAALFVCLMTAAGAAGCSDRGEEPPEEQTAVRLSLVDASVREVFLHITVDRSHVGGSSIVLERDGIAVRSFPAVADTTLADTGLTQGTHYQYIAVLQTGERLPPRSSALQAVTLLPTSHAFQWQSFLFGGEGGTGSFTDAAIINDTTAYAVGEIYLNDSLGNADPLPYNFAVWNGRQWRLTRIMFSTICGQPGRTPYPASSVVAFSPNDVWIAMDGSQMAHWNGLSQTETVCMPEPFAIARIWGENPGSIWAAGLGGHVSHFVNGVWHKAETGTTETINDVWGTTNPAIGQSEVYCAVTTYVTNGERGILKITDGTNVERLPWSPGRKIFCVWTNKGFPLYTAGDGVFENSRGVWQEHALAGVFTGRVRGNGLNDILVSGGFGMLMHYNGLDWAISTAPGNPALGSVQMKGNFAVAVGQQGSQGIIAIGRR